MSYKYWLLLGSLVVAGAAQTVGCSSEFNTCEARRTCAPGGASGVAGVAGAGTDGGEAGADQGGSAGLDAQAGEAGTADANGSAGTAGDSNFDTELEIAPPTLAVGKTYVPFTGTLSASGGAAHYTWTLTSGTLPAGLTLQGASSATVTIAGTATEAGQFPISLSVTDGSTTKTVDVTLTITHSALFLSDRNVAGVNELFLAELGAASSGAPVQLSASIPAGGGISSYAWSPDGSKVLYLATQSAGGAAELWVASLAAPGTAQRVSAAGVSVSQMIWLRAGNIGAYITGAGDAYLADLSGASPGASKLAVAGPASPESLTVSPNGSALIVDTNVSSLQSVLTSVSWAGGAPQSVTLEPGAPINAPTYSHDGRYGVANSANGGRAWDLSSASPIPGLSGWNFSFSWSPDAEVLLYAQGESTGPVVTMKVSRGVFSGGTVTSTTLVPATPCSLSASPWSPNGKSVLFRCNYDVRGINDVVAAAASTDFSLLPSGFLSNAFTDTPSVGWSPDSKWVALRADRDVDAQYDLQLIRWSAPGIAYKPHANSTASGVTAWAFAPNSQSVAFVGSIAPQSNAGLYLGKLPATGAPPTATLISDPATSVVQTDINWLPGSRVLAYRANVAGVAQLFAVPVAADGTAGSVVSISGVSGSGVSSYQLAPTH